VQARQACVCDDLGGKAAIPAFTAVKLTHGRCASLRRKIHSFVLVKLFLGIVHHHHHFIRSVAVVFISIVIIIVKILLHTVVSLWLN